MIRNTLKLKKYIPQSYSLIVRRMKARRERPFHQFRERDRGRGRSVAGTGLGKRGLTRYIAVRIDYRLLDPAMLIAEKYLKIVNIFTHALETKMSRLDDARMNRTYRDLMGARALQWNDFGRILISAERVEFRLCLFNRFKRK
jgi:hypothetical protein